MRQGPAGPDYILSQEEFRAGVTHLGGEIWNRRTEVKSAIAREADGLRSTAGWIAVSFSLWLFLIGCFLISGQVRGVPSR